MCVYSTQSATVLKKKLQQLLPLQHSLQNYAEQPNLHSIHPQYYNSSTHPVHSTYRIIQNNPLNPKPPYKYDISPIHSTFRISTISNTHNNPIHPKYQKPNEQQSKTSQIHLTRYICIYICISIGM